MSSETLIERLMADVRARLLEHSTPDNNGCWIWNKAKNNAGYGHFWVAGEICSAHRVAYEALVGDIPEGLFVLHKCDVRACVNPTHLFLGTNADNMADMANKGRAAVNRGAAKLSEDQVSEIIALAELGLTARELAEQFKVAKTTIARILNKQSWTNVA